MMAGSSREQLEEYEYIKIFARVKSKSNTASNEIGDDSCSNELVSIDNPSLHESSKKNDLKCLNQVRSPRHDSPSRSSSPNKQSSCFNFAILDKASENIKGNRSTPLKRCATPTMRGTITSISTPTEKTRKVLSSNSSPRRPNLYILTTKEPSSQGKALVTPVKYRIEKSDTKTEINSIEEKESLRCITVKDDKTLQLQTTVDQSPRGNQKISNFEKVFRESSSQEEVYIDAIQNNVSTLFQGINSTVITYGAPGSGKTFTLQGTKAMPGVIPRSLRDIFAYIANAKGDCDRKDFKVDISFVELLQSNQFRNVLKEPSSTDVRSRTPSCHPDSNSDTDFSTWTAAAKRVPVNSADEAMAAIEDTMKISKKRNNGKIDENFSRGHLIFTVYVCTTISCSENVYIPKDETFESFLNTCGDESEKITEILQGRLHFVELASTDRVSSNLSQTHYIKLSMLAFGEVLTRLSVNAVKEFKICQQRMMETHGSISNLLGEDSLAGGASECNERKTTFPFSETNDKLKLTAARNEFLGCKSPTNCTSKRDSAVYSSSGHSINDSVSALRMLHVPYMDSKLTLLLRDSLGGNSRTVMITTIDPCIESYSQNLYSLNLAMKASKVLNHPTANQIKTVEKVSECPTFKEHTTTSPRAFSGNFSDPKSCLSARARKRNELLFMDVSLPTDLSSSSTTQAAGKTYSVVVDNLQILDIEAGKSTKVFPIYSYVKVGLGQHHFQTVRRCQINAVTSFSEAFKFNIDEEELKQCNKISIDVIVGGFDEPDHASGTLLINDEDRLTLGNFPMKGNSSVATLLSGKLAWDTDLCSQTINDNRPTISCKVSILDEELRKSIEQSVLTDDSPIVYTSSPLMFNKISTVVAVDTTPIVDEVMESPEPLNETDVFCVKINSVAVNGLSCVEKVGRTIRRHNATSKNIFFALQFGNFWKARSKEYSLSAYRQSTSCQWDNLDLSFYPTRGDLRNFCIQLSVFSRETEPSKGSVDSLLGIAYIPLSSNVTSTAPLHEVPCMTLEHPSRENTERVTINYEIKVASDERWFAGKILDCNRADCNKMSQPIITDTFNILYGDSSVEKNVPNDVIRKVNAPKSTPLESYYRPLVTGDAVFVKSTLKLEEERTRELLEHSVYDDVQFSCVDDTTTTACKTSAVVVQTVVVEENKVDEEINQQRLAECYTELAVLKRTIILRRQNLQVSTEKINEVQKILDRTKAKLLEEARGRARAHELAAALSKAKAKIEVDLQRMPSNDPFDTMEISLAEKSRLEGERQAHQMKSKRGELEQELAKLTAARDRAEEALSQQSEVISTTKEQLRCVELVLELAKREKLMLNSMLEHAADETKLLVAAKSKAEVEAREREDVKAKEARKKVTLQILDSTPIRTKHRTLRLSYEKGTFQKFKAAGDNLEEELSSLYSNDENSINNKVTTAT